MNSCWLRESTSCFAFNGQNTPTLIVLAESLGFGTSDKKSEDFSIWQFPLTAPTSTGSIRKLVPALP